MSTIVAGRFSSVPEAEEVARKLYAHGFSVWDVSIMSVAPGGGRTPGVLLATRAKGERRQAAADLLREGGASDLEQAKGNWEGGQWTDFDPGRKPALLDEEAGEFWPAPAAARGTGKAADTSKAADTGKAADTDPGDGERAAHAGSVAEEAVAVDSTGNEDPGSELEHFVDRQVAGHS